MAGLNSVDWNEERRETLQGVLENSNQGIYCNGGEVSMQVCIENSHCMTPESKPKRHHCAWTVAMILL